MGGLLTPGGGRMAVGRPPPGRHNLVMIGSGECLAGGLDVSDIVPPAWELPRNVEGGQEKSGVQRALHYVFLISFLSLLCSGLVFLYVRSFLKNTGKRNARRKVQRK